MHVFTRFYPLCAAGGERVDQRSVVGELTRQCINVRLTRFSLSRSTFPLFCFAVKRAKSFFFTLYAPQAERGPTSAA